MADILGELASRDGVVVPPPLQPERFISVDPDTRGGQPVITDTPSERVIDYHPGATAEPVRDAVSFALCVDRYTPESRAA